MRHGFGVPSALLLILATLSAPGCNDEDDGAFPGASDVQLLVTTRNPDALELFDAQTFLEALDSPLELSSPPLEARAAGDTAIFVVSLDLAAEARAFDSRLFAEIPGSVMEEGGRIAFDEENARIYLAASRLAFFDSRDFSRLGFPPIDLGGEASDVVYDPATGRIFVALSGGTGPRLRVFDATNLAEVPPSPLDLLGGAATTTADLLLIPNRSELFVALREAERIAGIDPVTLRPLPRTPIEVRVEPSSLAFDPERERLYAASEEGSLESVQATVFSLSGGFPRAIASAVADLAFDPATQRLFAADPAARTIVVLDALTLEEEADSPIDVQGVPVSVEVIDLREGSAFGASRGLLAPR